MLSLTVDEKYGDIVFAAIKTSFKSFKKIFLRYHYVLSFIIINEGCTKTSTTKVVKAQVENISCILKYISTHL